MDILARRQFFTRDAYLNSRIKSPSFKYRTSNGFFLYVIWKQFYGRDGGSTIKRKKHCCEQWCLIWGDGLRVRGPDGWIVGMMFCWVECLEETVSFRWNIYIDSFVRIFIFILLYLYLYHKLNYRHIRRINKILWISNVCFIHEDYYRIGKMKSNRVS